MELIDVLDETGKRTGIIKTKVEVHRQGLWHRTVHVWIINLKNEILLQLRSEQKETHPNMWDISAAGHVSSGEDSQLAALRETAEEIGIDLDISDLQLIGTTKKETVLNNGTYFNKEFSDIYLVKLDLTLAQLRPQEREVKELRWLLIEEFKKWVQEKKTDLVLHVEEYNILFKVI